MLAISTVVGGNDKHYVNLQKCIRSLERLNRPYHMYITEFGNKLTTDLPNIHIEHRSDKLFHNGRFIDHILWKAKYESMLNCPLNDYVLYLDTDTVIVNDTIDTLIEQTNGKFGATEHFWTRTCNDFVDKTQPRDIEALKNAILSMGATDDFTIFAGGVFFFLNSQDNINILKEILNIHNQFYPNEDAPFIDRFTDEVITSYVLHKRQAVAALPGSLNHCAMTEMPLSVENNILVGKNPFENIVYPITALHCDTFRRNPSLCWDEPVKTLVKNAFYL